MVLALAKDDIKTLEDFATCADWELAGGWTTVDGVRVKDDGILEPFEVSLEEAQTHGDDRPRDAGLGRSRGPRAAAEEGETDATEQRRPRPDPSGPGRAHGAGGQPKDHTDGPERKCIATGEVQPKEASCAS